MKRLLTISLAVFIAVAFLSISEAQKKQAAKQKDKPCITECNKEHKKCLNTTRKTKKAERKSKLAECNKAQKECKENCDKPKEPAAK